jgi:signal transduction histidine kinase
VKAATSVREMERTCARLESLVEEHAALRRVATLVAADVDANVLFDRVCQELAGVIGVESTDMIRFTGDRAATVVGVWAAPGAPTFPIGAVIPVDGGTVTAKLYRSGRPQRVDDYSGIDGELAAKLRAAGFMSVVGAPITVANRLWGALMASSPRPYAFPEDTEQRIADFANLVTAALANADARDQLAASRARIVEAGDAERRRIGRDLHDGAQQELVGAALSLSRARQKLTDSSDEAGELVSAAIEQVQAGLRDLRELATGIHPSVLTDRGLRAALEALATRSPLIVEIGEVPAGRLAPSVETTAYFVVAEALTNAAKHARCDCVEVSVRLDGEWVIVTVRDDGAGGANPSRGSGLRGLDDRVSALGGELVVDSPPGAGTAIVARLALGFR